MNEFQEETVSTQKPVTLILFSTKRNLTRTELKKTFGVKKGKLLKVGRHQRAEGDVFNKLFAIQSSSIEDGRYYDFDDKKWVTHFYILSNLSCIKDFAVLKYGEELLGGFDLSRSDAEKLQKILTTYQSYASLITSSKRMLEDLLKKASAPEIEDCLEKTKLIESLTGADHLFKNFIYPKLAVTKQEVDVWYQTHRWKDPNLN
jgi:hypothetical protein